MATSCSTFVIDDDYYAQQALSLLIARDERTRVWGTASSIAEALETLRTAATPGPDVVLLDVQFESDPRAGVDALPTVRDAAPAARILVTSVLRDEDVVVAAVRAGADGFVWKNESGNGIATAISRVADGRFVVTPGVADAVFSAIDELRRRPDVLGDEADHAELTTALRKTLYLFCVCGMSVKEIAAELQVSSHTVSARIKTAYQILDAGSRSEAFTRLVEREAGQP